MLELKLEKKREGEGEGGGSFMTLMRKLSSVAGAGKLYSVYIVRRDLYSQIQLDNDSPLTMQPDTIRIASIFLDRDADMVPPRDLASQTHARDVNDVYPFRVSLTSIKSLS